MGMAVVVGAAAAVWAYGIALGSVVVAWRRWSARHENRVGVVVSRGAEEVSTGRVTLLHFPRQSSRWGRA